MVNALSKRNLDPDSDSRPLEPEDFQKFDYIIGMNDENHREVEKAAQYWKDTLKKPIPGDWRNKVSDHILAAIFSNAEGMFLFMLESILCFRYCSGHSCAAPQASILSATVDIMAKPECVLQRNLQNLVVTC